MGELLLQSGRVIADRYRLRSKLGQGGMGSVWRAEHLTLGSDVAIKLIDQAIAEDTEVQARFLREAQAAAKLRSPHVVQMLDYGVDHGLPFIAMELMAGESLAQRLERLGRLTPEETARVVTEVSRALALAHGEGIIHRDLKPDNIFLVKNDDSELAKVLDFGVAKTQGYGAAEASKTSTGAVLGTPYYMSPEQAEGSKDLDHRTDIWALGVIAYECLVGLRPFEAETLGGLFLAICTRPKPVPSQLVTDLPAGFDAWFAKCTARLLPDRFRTAKDAAAALRDVVEGRSSPELGQPREPLAATETSVSADIWAQTHPIGSPPAASSPQRPLTTTAGLGSDGARSPSRKGRAALLYGLVALVLVASGTTTYLARQGTADSQDEGVSVDATPQAPSTSPPSSAPAATTLPSDREEVTDETREEAESAVALPSPTNPSPPAPSPVAPTTRNSPPRSTGDSRAPVTSVSSRTSRPKATPSSPPPTPPAASAPSNPSSPAPSVQPAPARTTPSAPARASEEVNLGI